MFNINFVDDWIRTADLWYWKQPLYKLSHNQFLTVFFSSFSYYLFRFYLLMMMMTTIIMVIKCFPLSLSLSLSHLSSSSVFRFCALNGTILLQLSLL